VYRLLLRGAWWLKVFLTPWQEDTGSFYTDGLPSRFCAVNFGAGKGVDCALASLCYVAVRDTSYLSLSAQESIDAGLHYLDENGCLGNTCDIGRDGLQ
jgi:hypothetical protein